VIWPALFSGVLAVYLFADPEVKEFLGARRAS
jgi:hypothetical protein